MSPLSLLVAVLALATALASTAWLARFIGTPDASNRSAPIDGLRGYLAYFVYLHHAFIWQGFLQDKGWQTPAVRLFAHFGQASVSLFFMITAFLFFGKLIDGRAKPIDWLRLMVSRLLRLGPLYLFAMALLFGIVAIESAGRLAVPPMRLLQDAASWLAFTIPGTPDLNGVAGSWRILAGVTWSLPYEWLFYAALPLLALTTRSAVSVRQLAFSVLAVAGIAALARPTAIALVFTGGIVAAVLATSSSVRAFCCRRTASLLVIACIGLLVTLFPTSNQPRASLLLTLVFIAIACGNSLFGSLTSRLSRTLGEITYSVYLLHGLLLYGVFRFVLGYERAAALSPVAYWLLVIGLTPLLLGLSTLTFLCIERPALAHTNRLTAWLRARSQWPSPAAPTAGAG